MALNKKLDEYLSTSNTNFAEMKQFLYDNLTERAQEVLRARSFGELGSASGVSLPPAKGAFIFVDPMTAPEQR